MELDELQQAWQQYDRKLDRYLELNRRVLKEINMQKTRSHLRMISIRSILEAGFFLVVMITLGNFMAQHPDRMPLFLPALVLNVFAIIGLSGSVGQIVLISQIDYSAPIASLQRKLQRLRTHFIQTLRLTLLSIPFYMAYILLGFYLLWGVDLYLYGDRNWWIAQIILSVALVPLALWLYRKIHHRNMHLPWVRRLVYSAGGRSVEKAMALLGELEDFEQEDSTDSMR